jgi:PAS domain S-box-containing protein
VDITERKRTEDALRESEEFSSSLRDHSPFPIMVINSDTSIRYVNPALEKLSGFSAVELVGQKTPYSFFRENYQQQHIEIFPVQMQSTHSVEALFHKKSGESFYVDITSTPIKEDGHTKYILSMWVDITAQKTANEQLEQLYQSEKTVREALQVEIKSRTEFTRALVHELKTPLTPILASSELLMEELTEEPLLGLAKNVYRGAENMNRRVDELLDLARGEVGILQVNLNPVDPKKLLREAVDYMRPSATGSGQALILDLPAELPIIIADDDRVRQILFNLISNSIKFSSRNGEIRISAFEKGIDLVIEVKDQGRGMTDSEQEKLFQPYYRIEGRERLSGLGLGLALSKKLVELQNGRIWVKSEKSKGSTFSFTLPKTTE